MSASDLIQRRGRVAAPLALEIVRELTPTDLLRLHEAPLSSVPVLQRLKAMHHRQAKLIADGYTLREVAAACDTTAQRLTQLMKDPTFTDLVACYSDMEIARLLDDSARVRDKLIDVGETALDEIRDRLNDESKVKMIPIGELRQIAELGFDRTVAPPKPAVVPPAAPPTITLNFGTGLRPQRTIDVTPSGTPPEGDG
jgi:hypothetical protein